MQSHKCSPFRDRKNAEVLIGEYLAANYAVHTLSVMSMQQAQRDGLSIQLVASYTICP